ncbi:hypothetical protein [Mesorhizobium temperatum]|uniref:hypothetical protein n=1 Tax=Mesorhizobium temperatum TaxID=241416 RepID=UPI00197EA3A3|nr:hypothetical protein [Mesorhizobium temperatum]
MFAQITHQLKAQAIQVKTGTLVDATTKASASEDDGEGCWVKHQADLRFMASMRMSVPTQIRL